MRWEPYGRSQNYSPDLDAIKAFAYIIISPYGFSNTFEGLSQEVSWSPLAQTLAITSGVYLDLAKYVGAALGAISVVDKLI